MDVIDSHSGPELLQVETDEALGLRLLHRRHVSTIGHREVLGRSALDTHVPELSSVAEVGCHQLETDRINLAFVSAEACIGTGLHSLGHWGLAARRAPAMHAISHRLREGTCMVSFLEVLMVIYAPIEYLLHVHGESRSVVAASRDLLSATVRAPAQLVRTHG